MGVLTGIRVTRPKQQLYTKRVTDRGQCDPFLCNMLLRTFIVLLVLEIQLNSHFLSLEMCVDCRERNQV
jgi:hypothetical protein